MATPMPEEQNEKPPKKARKCRYTVFFCHGSDCTKNGAKETCKELRAQVRELGLKHEVQIIKTECADLCKLGPIVIVGQEDCGTACGLVWYRKVHPKDTAALANDHLLNGHPLEKKRLHDHDA